LHNEHEARNNEPDVVSVFSGATDRFKLAAAFKIIIDPDDKASLSLNDNLIRLKKGNKLN